MGETVRVVIQCPCCDHLLNVKVERRANLMSGQYAVSATPRRAT